MGIVQALYQHGIALVVIQISPQHALLFVETGKELELRPVTMETVLMARDVTHPVQALSLDIHAFLILL